MVTGGGAEDDDRLAGTHVYSFSYRATIALEQWPTKAVPTDDVWGCGAARMYRSARSWHIANDEWQSVHSATPKSCAHPGFDGTNTNSHVHQRGHTDGKYCRDAGYACRQQRWDCKSVTDGILAYLIRLSRMSNGGCKRIDSRE